MTTTTSDLDWDTGPDTTDEDTPIPITSAFEEVPDEDIDPSSVAVEPEVVTTGSDGSWVGRSKKGVCEVCGEKAWDGRAYRCTDHRDLPKLESGRLRTPRGHKGSPNSLVPRIKASDIKKAILDANKDIVKFSAIATGIPSEWLDPRDAKGNTQYIAEVVVGINEDGSPKTMRFFDPCLHTQLSVTEKQAEMIANGLVAFTETKTGQRLTLLGTAVAPHATLIAAGGVVLMHVVKLGNIKAQVQQLKVELQKAREQQQGIPQARSVDPDDVYGHGDVA